MKLFKRSEKSAKQKELTQKYLKDSFKNETTKINIDALNNSNTDIEFLYDRFQTLDSTALKYKLVNEKLTNDEKKVIKRILDERK